MSDFKYGQVKMAEKLWKKFTKKLADEGMNQQGFFISRIKKFVNPKKKKK